MAMETQRHLDDEEIERYSMGHISEAESAGFEEHLLICESCQNRVAEIDEYVSAMAAAGAELYRQPEKQKWYSLFFVRLMPMSAAAAVATVLVLLGIRVSQRQSPIPAVQITLQATRGTAIAAHAPQGRPVAINLDSVGLPERPDYRVSVVDQSSNVIWSGPAKPQASKLSATAPAMHAGTYFVRVQDQSGKLLREYGLEITER